MEPAEARRLCGQFSRFFVDKLGRIAEVIKSRLATHTRRTVVQRPQCQSEMICLTAATVDEVARQIKRLPPKSSPSDCLPVSLLKASVDVMAPLLAQLANLSSAAGVFPSRYKVGHVTPLLKLSLIHI